NGEVAVYRSSDGANWEDLSNGTGLDSWQDFREIEYLEGAFYASGHYSRARRSTDAGQTWSSTQTGDYHQLTGYATINGGLYYGVGYNLNNSYADIDLISTDGINWIPIDPGNLEDRNEITAFKNTFITVGNSGRIRQSATVTDSIGYQAFASEFFASGGSNANSNANPDSDWASNIFEYALGGSPDSANDAPERPRLYFEQTGNLAFEILRDFKRSDIAYSAWWSTDLQTWTRSGLTVIEDTSTRLRVRTEHTFEAQNRAFFRLRLDRSDPHSSQ
ncbi:hypothetical protein QEH59_13105, partial [Coraliomargarita sp. SDUM461004]